MRSFRPVCPETSGDLDPSRGAGPGPASARVEQALNFLSFLTSRLSKAVVVVLGVVIINFFLIRLAPGDPASVMAGEAGASDPAFVTQLREEFGLDKPLPVQLGIYLKGVATLDLGYSYRNHLPVLDLILDRLPATLLLMSGAFVFSIVMGVLLGVISARTRYENKRRWIDSVVMSGALLLPTVSLGCFFMAVYVRLTRASMLEVMGMDFVKTARAKGVPANRVIRVHVLRNALLPVVTFAGIQLGQMAGGAVLTETVFSWPGIGRLMFDALLQRDYQLLLGIFFVTATLVVIFNLLTDIVYRFIDPRISVGGKGASA
jgi:peptide/nickel transport system permease protein